MPLVVCQVWCERQAHDWPRRLYRDAAAISGSAGMMCDTWCWDIVCNMVLRYTATFVAAMPGG